MNEFKYKINEKVWILYGHKAVETEITGRNLIESNGLCNWGNVKTYCVNLIGLGGSQMNAKNEELLFKTKEELLASL